MDNGYVGVANDKCVLQVAVKTIPFYTDYFNVPYPLPKIDLIAIAQVGVKLN